MNEETQAPDLHKALSVLRARIWLIIACTLLVAGSAYGFSKLQTKQYTASAALLFRAPGLDQQAAGVSNFAYKDPQRETDTNVRLVKLGPTAERTAEVIGGLAPEAVFASVEVSSSGATDLATVSATAQDPDLAARIANTFTEQFIAGRREVDERRVLAARDLVERRIRELSPQQRKTIQGQTLIERSESLRILASLQTGNAELVERAVPPVAPSSPQVTRNTMLGGFLGLLLGIGLSLLVTRLDRRMREPEDLRTAFGLPVLGVVPESTHYVGASNGKGEELPARELEAFRMLRAHLRYFNVDRELRSVLVTSAVSGEGKSTVALYLAKAAATMGTRTLLIETDLRRPSIAGRLGLAPGAGIGEVLIGAVEPLEAIRAVPVVTGVNGKAATARLDVLIVGGIPPNPAELVESHAMEELLAWASRNYELVIVDTPPLTVVSDAIPLLRKVDGVIIVSRLGQSTRDSAGHLRERLASLGAPTLGVVGNGYDEGRTGYGYGYGYYDREAEVARDN